MSSKSAFLIIIQWPFLALEKKRQKCQESWLIWGKDFPTALHCVLVQLITLYEKSFVSHCSCKSSVCCEVDSFFIRLSQRGERQQLVPSRSSQFGSVWAGIKNQNKFHVQSFSLFSLNFKWKMLVVMVSMNFSWIFNHFDV